MEGAGHERKERYATPFWAYFFQEQRPFMQALITSYCVDDGERPRVKAVLGSQEEPVTENLRGPQAGNVSSSFCRKMFKMGAGSSILHMGDPGLQFAFWLQSQPFVSRCSQEFVVLRKFVDL